MTRMLTRSVSTFATLILAGLLGLAPAANAQSDDGHCSNQTLHGAYGFAVEGTLFANTYHPLLLLRAVALTTFDGKGSLTQVDHYVVNGTPQTPPANPW